MGKNEIYNILERNYFGSERHENTELLLLKELIYGVDLFIDVGASLGPYTKEASEILKNAKIISIEADPIRYERLTVLAKTWQNTSSNKIVCVHCAVGSCDGDVDFFSTLSNTSGALAPIERRVDGTHLVKVPLRTLDTILLTPDNKRYKKFIKMDIEGGEYMALKGSSKILQSESVDWLIELHSWGDSANKKYPHHVLGLMKKYRYHFKLIHKHYYFSKSLKLKESHSYFFHILLWALKSFLRNFLDNLRKSGFIP